MQPKHMTVCFYGLLVCYVNVYNSKLGLQNVLNSHILIIEFLLIINLFSNVLLNVLGCWLIFDAYMHRENISHLFIDAYNASQIHLFI